MSVQIGDPGSVAWDPRTAEFGPAAGVSETAQAVFDTPWVGQRDQMSFHSAPSPCTSCA